MATQSTSATYKLAETIFLVDNYHESKMGATTIGNLVGRLKGDDQTMRINVTADDAWNDFGGEEIRLPQRVRATMVRSTGLYMGAHKLPDTSTIYLGPVSDRSQVAFRIFAITELPLVITELANVSEELVEWQILPPSQVREVVADCMYEQGDKLTDKQKQQRYDAILLLTKAQPERWVVGRKLGRSDYVVAIFKDVAVAVCPRYGNAIYIASVDHWRETLSKRKDEAVKDGATRIIHRGKWRDRLRHQIGAA